MMMMMMKPRRLAALVAGLTLRSTANFASAINDYSSLRGSAIANSNGSNDNEIWSEKPVTDGSNHVNYQKQRNLQKKKMQPTRTTPTFMEEEETLVEQLDEEWNEVDWEEGVSRHEKLAWRGY
ncbi:hypothetical protein ACHAXM_001283 [Skeletonema potamos]